MSASTNTTMPYVLPDPATRVDEERRASLFEIHYRVPRPIKAATAATHITRLANTPEDRYYDCVVSEARADDVFGLPHFKSEIPLFQMRNDAWTALVKDKLLARLIDVDEVVKKWKSDTKILSKQYEIQQYSNDQSLIAAFDLYKNQAETGYEITLRYKPSLFVFGAHHEVLRHVGRYMTDINGRNHILSIFLENLSIGFKNFSTKSLEQLFVRDPVKAHTHQLSSSDFGGLRAKFDPFNAKYRSSVDDFRDVPIENLAKKGSVLRGLEYRLRWARNPQDWTYTYIESIRNAKALAHLDIYSEFLLTALLHPYIGDATAIPLPRDAEVTLSNNGYPGTLLAGANYLFLPLRYLLAACASDPTSLGWLRPEDMVGRVLEYRHITDTNRCGTLAREIFKHMSNSASRLKRKRLIQELVSESLVALDPKEIVSIIKESKLSTDFNPILVQAQQSPKDSHQWNDFVDKILDSDDINTPRTIHLVFRCLETIVLRNLGRSTISDAERHFVLNRIAHLTKTFWELSFHREVDSEVVDVQGDYVCSALMDGRCIYFSNFLPVKPDDFTQTIFVDLGMNSFERGRTLQKLCDISTYRSVSIRDLPRVKASISGLNECNRALNLIQAKIDSPLTVMPPSQLSDRLRQHLADIVNVSDQLNRMNSLLTYGMVGKWFSSKAYIDQIHERCKDINEIRLSHYASLGDYVVRRLDHSIRYVERMNALQQAVSDKITHLMERVRTQLDTLQTQNILETLGAAKNTITSIEKTTFDIDALTKAMRRSLQKQIGLARTAEVLVYVAGTYYVYGLIEELIYDMSTFTSSLYPGLEIWEKMPKFWSILLGYFITRQIVKYVQDRMKIDESADSTEQVLSTSHLNQASQIAPPSA
jgi:uncharacterized membrane-anchored protein